MFSIHKKPVASVSAPQSNPPQTQTKPAVTFSSAPPPSSSPLQTVAQDLAKVRLLSPLGVSSFSFPYTAYPIQNDLMRAIYTCIKTRRVGVFESPTGTGKTLSVICSTLTFLKEQYQLGDDDDDDDDDNNSIQQVAVGGGGGGGGQHFKYSRPSTPVDDDEPDWCLNFESERSSTVKALTLKRAKAFRDTLSEKLEQLRLTTDSRISGISSNGIAISGGGGGGGGVSLGPPRVSKAERRARYLRLRQSQTQTGLGTKISSSIKRERDDDRSDSDGFGADKNVGKIVSRENGDLIGEDMDIHLLPPEYHSDEDEDLRAEAIATSVSATVGIADRIREQVARERATQTPQIDEEEDKEEAAAFRPKIIFVSRTHSQISQFVREISKTAFGKTVRVVALGSRSTLCVNPEVVDLPTDARVNERCLELQDEARAGSSISGDTSGTGKGSKKQPNQRDISTGKNTINTLSTVSETNTSKLTSASSSTTTGKGGSKGCPFIDTASQEMFRDRLLAGLRDIEEAAELGWTAGTCAYYGSRKAVKYAEVVAMPYSMLLHSGTRTAAGIEPHLKGSVVIIDEAHNIIDAINSTHAALVTHQQLVIAAATVKEYLTKYKSRMKGSNVAHCTMLAEAFQSLAIYLKPVSSTTLSSSSSTSSSSSSSSAPTFSATSVPKGSSPNTDSLLPLVSSRLVSFSHEGGGGGVKGFAPISASCSPPISRPDSPFAVSVSVSTIAAQMASESLIISSTTTAPTTPTFTSITLPISRSISPHHNTPRTYTTNSSLPGSTVATSSRGGGGGGGSYGHGLQSDSQLLFSPVVAPPPVSSHATSALRPIPHASFTSTVPPILLHNNINAPSTLSSTSVIPPTTTTSAIAPAPTPALPNSSVHTVSDFLASSGITLANPTSSSSTTSTNLFKVRRYVETVDLLKKLRGFAEAGARAAAAVAASEVTIHTHAKKHQKGPQQQQQQQHQSHTMSETSVISSSGGVLLDDITTTNSNSNISLLPTSQSYMASVTAIQTAYNFLCCLMGADCDGRVVVNRLGIDLNTTRGGDATTSSSSTTTTTTTAQPFFKFVLLNPAVPFLRVVQDARSVVLVGGTMQPISDITDQLFGHLPLNRVMTFSCGHVIPSENLSAFTVSKGPTGIAFDFRHATRSSPIMIAELGRALVNLSALIPSGLVVFMPSYDYLRTALSVWSKPTQQSQQSQQNTSNASTQGGGGGGGLQSHTQLPGSLPQALPGSVLAMLQKKKKVFAEPKSSSDVDAVLRAYTSAIRTPNQTQSGYVHHGLTSAGSTTQPSSLNNSDTEFEFDTITSLHSTSRHTSRPSSRPSSRTGTGVEGGGGRVFLDTVSDEHMINNSTHMTIESSIMTIESSIPVSKQTTSGTSGGGGALLFCVVGGKMSEGINFSDDLARGVAVVGLPYPNPSDPELVERMAYLDRRAAVAVASASSASSQMNISSILPLVSGREYYENITIRAVNQAIGRSIRHANDYAVIVLLDGRYSQHRIKSKLPGWIGERLQTQGVGGGVGDVTSWGPCAAGIGSFFRKKASASTI
jgi:Rad3-related DNA helicase